jgi:hypothetical protein
VLLWGSRGDHYYRGIGFPIFYRSSINVTDRSLRDFPVSKYSLLRVVWVSSEINIIQYVMIYYLLFFIKKGVLLYCLLLLFVQQTLISSKTRSIFLYVMYSPSFSSFLIQDKHFFNICLCVHVCRYEQYGFKWWQIYW